MSEACKSQREFCNKRVYMRISYYYCWPWQVFKQRAVDARAAREEKRQKNKIRRRKEVRTSVASRLSLSLSYHTCSWDGDVGRWGRSKHAISEKSLPDVRSYALFSASVVYTY